MYQSEYQPYINFGTNLIAGIAVIHYFSTTIVLND